MFNPNFHWRSAGISSFGAENFLKILRIDDVYRWAAKKAIFLENRTMFREQLIGEFEHFGKTLSFTKISNCRCQACLERRNVIEWSHFAFSVFSWFCAEIVETFPVFQRTRFCFLPSPKRRYTFKMPSFWDDKISSKGVTWRKHFVHLIPAGLLQSKWRSPTVCLRACHLVLCKLRLQTATCMVQYTTTLRHNGFKTAWF